MAVILDGKNLADKITSDLKREVALLKKVPSLAVVLVGDNPASKIYVNKKAQKAYELGIKSEVYTFSDCETQESLEKNIELISNKDDVDAVLVQLPLPKRFDEKKIINKISPAKDVDGFHPYNLGKLLSGDIPYATACTPLGIMELLKEYNISPEGKNVVIVGRSNIVGKPLAVLMTNANATVTLCHSKTKNLCAITQQADILVVAIGKPTFIKAGDIKEGAVVIDVGINRLEDGKIVGDVDFENVKEKASYITPVPKGVGPMTIALLMKNTISLSKNR
ncbi:MAG: bifunctional methylenetetrahydrofolate dehydrogenase/methenyltetrahydrofolate cyclohydrolase FolD [bacterium]|nr:bifunctional methylenetetrahydrofolate dehydrogenase/methenyltetrahydrofolate cyclohydrolase FolD [bacterium]